MTPFRGLVLGWYHQRNAGDDRLAHCIERWLNDHKLFFWPHTYTPPADVLSCCDYVIMGGGSIANAHHGAFFGMHRWIEAAKVPVFGVGLTVSRIAALCEEFKAIPASGGLVWVRDQQSADALRLRAEQCIVAPDLSWLFPLKAEHFGLGTTKRSGVAVNFRSWPMRSWSPSAWSEPIASISNAVPYPLCFSGDDDRRILRQVFNDDAFCALQNDAEFDPTLAARSEMVIAMRFHAILFAIQAGTPFVALGNSRKLAWMLEGLNLDDFIVPVEDPQQLKGVLEEAYKMDAQKLQNITTRQKDLAWEAANMFKTHIETQAEIRRTRRIRENSRVAARIKRRWRSFTSK